MQNTTSEVKSARLCPVCGVPLAPSKNALGVYWSCPSCDGRLVALALLRKTVIRAAINEIWQQAQQAAVGEKRCVECRHPMRLLPAKHPILTISLDVCVPCTLIWFDPHEFEALPALPPVQQEAAELPPAAREALAMAKVNAIREQYEQKADQPEVNIDSAWQLVADLFGLTNSH